MPSGASKSREYAKVTAAVNAERSKQGLDAWVDEERQRVACIRARVGSLKDSSGIDDLTEHLQAVRRASGRPELTASEIALVPRDQALVNALLDLARFPLTFQPARHGQALQAVQAGDMRMDADPELAEYYIRLFGFATKQKLHECLTQVVTALPQYRFLLARVEQGLLEVSDGKPVALAYGGYTVSRDAAGRDEADAGSERSFVHAIYQSYPGSASLFTFPALAFPIRGCIAARADQRTSLFESLVVDSLGFVCANAAPPGQILERAVPLNVSSLISDLNEWQVGADLLRSLTGSSGWRSSRDEPARKSKTQSTSAARRSAQPPMTEASEKGEKVFANEDSNTPSTPQKKKGKRPVPLSPRSPAKRSRK